MANGRPRTPLLEALLQRRLPPALWLAMGSAMIMSIGAHDMSAGPYRALSVLNIIPVVFIGLFAGRSLGLVGAIEASTFAVLHAYRTLPTGLDAPTALWNLTSSGLMFLIMADLGGRL